MMAESATNRLLPLPLALPSPNSTLSSIFRAAIAENAVAVQAGIALTGDEVVFDVGITVVKHAVAVEARIVLTEDRVPFDVGRCPVSKLDHPPTHDRHCRCRWRSPYPR